jgi:hypothetical protein
MARSAIRRPDPLVLAALACLSVGPAGAQDQVIAATIDPTDEGAAFDAIGSFVAALPVFPSIVGIDLTILPDSDGVLGVFLVGSQGGDPVPVPCTDGTYGRIVGDHAEIRLPALSLYTHMLLQVDLNGQSARTGLVLSCEYQGSTAPAFRMMGRFLVSKASIPTAEDVLMAAQPAE